MQDATQQKLQELRVKAREKTITIDELREAIVLMRQDRVGASYTSEKSRAKGVAKPKANAEDLLSQLENF